jgi:hypothetical protein
MKQHATKCRKGLQLERTKSGCGFVPEGTCTCDGYHTFDELYDHRIALFITLCRLQSAGNQCDDFNLHFVWRSKRHSDGELCFGTGTMYVLGIGTKPGEQVTYHLPIGRWDETGFARTLETAPEWDGHSSDDVLERLKHL